MKRKRSCRGVFQDPLKLRILFWGVLLRVSNAGKWGDHRKKKSLRLYSIDFFLLNWMRDWLSMNSFQKLESESHAIKFRSFLIQCYDWTSLFGVTIIISFPVIQWSARGRDSTKCVLVVYNCRYDWKTRDVTLECWRA